MGNTNERKKTGTKKFLVVTIAAGTILCLVGIYLVAERIMPPPIMHIELGDPRLSDLEYFGASAESYTPDPSSGGLKYRQYDPGKFPPSAPNAPADGQYSSMNFYEYHWPKKYPGMVEFTYGKHGTHNFTVPYVFSVLGTADSDPKIGIYSWDISFGATPDDAETHQLARDRFMEFLSKLRAAGWKRLISPDDPRLSGRDAWHYFTSQDGDIYSMDSSYIPSMNEWMVVKDQIVPRWEFYADGVYLTVSFMEWGTAPGKGAYLFSVKIEDEYSYYGLGYFGREPDKLANWRKFLPAEVRKLHLDRLAEEAKLKAEGYMIDRFYEDPPLEAEALRALAEKDGR